MKILIIDDELELCSALADFFNIHDEYEAIPLNDNEKTFTLIQEEQIDLLISDVRMPGLSGFDIARMLKEKKLKIPVILISGQEDVINSIDAIDLGIHDFLVKPLDMKKLLEVVREIRRETQKKEDRIEFNKLITQDEIIIDDILLPPSYIINDSFLGTVIIASDFMKTLLKKIKKLAQFPDIPILIQGPTGTGKEVVAKLIHYFSRSNKDTYVAVNCAAIEKNLFESELFGYSRGAFTGADPHGKDGKIKAAKGGLLFLDEITEISPDLQTKLLRVLQEKEYYKVGSNISEKVDTHIICATNQNIQKMVKDDRFRKDLFYRLDVCKLRLLPLNQRKEEIIPLSLIFIKKMVEAHSMSIKKIHKEVFDLLQNFSWPGNIRQLKNTLTKVLLFCESDILRTADFTFLNSQKKNKLSKINPFNFELPEKSFSLEQFAEDILYKALIKFKGNKSKTAEFLGLERHQLYYRYKNVIQQFENDEQKL